jgi:hypothetical protein
MIADINDQGNPRWVCSQICKTECPPNAGEWFGDAFGYNLVLQQRRQKRKDCQNKGPHPIVTNVNTVGGIVSSHNSAASVIPSQMATQSIAGAATSDGTSVILRSSSSSMDRSVNGGSSSAAPDLSHSQDAASSSNMSILTEYQKQNTTLDIYSMWNTQVARSVMLQDADNMSILFHYVSTTFRVKQHPDFEADRIMVQVASFGGYIKIDNEESNYAKFMTLIKRQWDRNGSGQSLRMKLIALRKGEFGVF